MKEKNLKRYVVVDNNSRYPLGTIVYGRLHGDLIEMFEDSQGHSYLSATDGGTTTRSMFVVEINRLKGDSRIKNIIDLFKTNVTTLEYIYKTGKYPTDPEIEKKAKKIFDVIKSACGIHKLLADDKTKVAREAAVIKRIVNLLED